MRSSASPSVRKARARSRARPATGAAALRPTVTDADVALGMIDPAAFAGGTISLNADLARAALAAAVGDPLGLSPRDRGLRGARDGVREHGERGARARGRARRGGERPHADRVRRRGAAACRARRRKARAGARAGAAQCRRRLGGRVSGGADFLRAGQEPPHAARQFRFRRRLRAARRDGARMRARWSSRARAARRSPSGGSPTCAMSGRGTRSRCRCRCAT